MFREVKGKKEKAGKEGRQERKKVGKKAGRKAGMQEGRKEEYLTCIILQQI